MAAAADGGHHLVGAAVVDGGNDVGGVDAAGDQSRAFVDHRVIDFARGVVSGVGGLDEFAAERSFQFLDGWCRHGIPPDRFWARFMRPHGSVSFGSITARDGGIY